MRPLQHALLIAGFAAAAATRATAQQFNSDNWWVLPERTTMGVTSLGQHYSSMYLGYGFMPGWEVDVAATLYPADDLGSTAHYSTTAFVKRLLYENESSTGGAAVMAGIGQGPGYYDSGVLLQDFESYWLAVPVTFPLFDNQLSWDVMPGGSWSTDFDQQGSYAGAFTYSSRMALYGVIPESSIVAEVFGAEGEAYAAPQYKAGVRWESEYLVLALTYGDGLNGNDGAGLELGLMFLTPPFP